LLFKFEIFLDEWVSNLSSDCWINLSNFSSFLHNLVFENREKMVLVMEFAAGGELYDYLSDRKVLTEEEARRIFRQVSTAIYYCHKHKICHRDLKLENILLDEQGNAKVSLNFRLFSGLFN
jgi:serine/threonine protein kinase